MASPSPRTAMRAWSPRSSRRPTRSWRWSCAWTAFKTTWPTVAPRCSTVPAGTGATSRTARPRTRSSPSWRGSSDREHEALHGSRDVRHPELGAVARQEVGGGEQARALSAPRPRRSVDLGEEVLDVVRRADVPAADQVVLAGVPEPVHVSGGERDGLAGAGDLLLTALSLPSHRPALDGERLLLQPVDVHRRAASRLHRVPRFEVLAALVGAAAEKRQLLAAAVVDRARVVAHRASIRRSSSSPSSAIGTRSCSSVSRSRRVTVESSVDWPSTVTPNGVPISSWRR